MTSAWSNGQARPASCRRCGVTFLRTSSKRQYCSWPCSFWSKVDVQGDDDCWSWQAARNAKGYGRFGPEMAVNMMAHRYALELHLGRPVRDGHFACHRCDNPPCCNPNHLFEGTARENTADAGRKGRLKPPPGNSIARRAATHCRNGHPYTPENTRIRQPEGTRYCAACHRERGKKSKAAKSKADGRLKRC